MIVPFAPGGASDFVGRIIQTLLCSELGNQPVFIGNRNGAVGNIGVETAALATPDGHTILLGNSGTMAINPALFPNFPIRPPPRDLIAVTQIVDVQGALVVPFSVPVASVKEFITYAKARLEKLNYGLLVSTARSACRWSNSRTRSASGWCIFPTKVAQVLPPSWSWLEKFLR